MKATLRLAYAIVLGFVVGSALNMGLIGASGAIIAPPAGADMTTAEGIRAALHLLEPRHYLMPFLAHALGTLCGAALAAKVAGERSTWAAAAVTCLFLSGGVLASTMIPAPVWFTLIDLALAYLPFGYLGNRMAGGRLASRSTVEPEA